MLLPRVHWTVINFTCKKGVSTQHTTFTSCQNSLVPMSFFLWWVHVDYALESNVLTEQNMWFSLLISNLLRARDTHIDFLRIKLSLFLDGALCPLMQEHFFSFFETYNLHYGYHGSDGPWKVLEKALCHWKVLENWKIVGYPWKVLEFSTQVLEYFWKFLE